MATGIIGLLILTLYPSLYYGMAALRSLPALEAAVMVLFQVCTLEGFSGFPTALFICYLVRADHRKYHVLKQGLRPGWTSGSDLVKG